MVRQPIRAARLLIAGLAAATILPAFGQNTIKDTTEPPAKVLAVERELLQKAAAGAEKHRKGEATITVRTAQGEPLTGVKVEAEQVAHEFLVGCIIFDLVRPKPLYKPELYKERFQGLFNFAVFPFYWRHYEARPGETVEDSIAEGAAWCRENGITTKGHPLVWTNRSGVPDWVRKGSPEASEKALLGRVTREVGNLAGAIDIWDVVNEPVNCRAWDHVDSKDYVREPINRIADYVDKAFRAAHRANPEALLILNEYNTIARPEVRDRFFQLVTELKRRGTPISGLGIQAHEPREHWYPPEEVLATFDRLASLGYPLHITEFMPQSGGKEITGGWREGRWTEQAQADFAEQFFRLSFGHPAIASINWWGMSDRRIWLPGGGLVDEEYQPKPVYRRLKKLLDEEWNTRTTVETNAQGTASFRGFFGKYAITVTDKEGKSRSFEAALKKGEENRWTFTDEEGFVALFNGRDLSGWIIGPDNDWAVQDGVITLQRKIDGKEHNHDYLWTEKTYGDFILELEFKIPQRANSGVFLRTSDLKNPVYTGIEVQVCNSHGRETLTRGGTAGAIYDCVAPSKNAVKKPDEWNHFRITCRGSQIIVVLNGQQVADMDLDRWTEPHKNPDGTPNKFATPLKDFARRGHVGLQDHGRLIWYRNIRIKVLDD